MSGSLALQTSGRQSDDWNPLTAGRSDRKSVLDPKNSGSIPESLVADIGHCLPRPADFQSAAIYIETLTVEMGDLVRGAGCVRMARRQGLTRLTTGS